VFQSWYRASDEYQIPVTALVIYTGEAKPVNTYFREWHGTSVNFKFNIYSVPSGASVEELKHDERPFSIPVLAAKRMLDAKGNALKREEYSFEILDLIKKRELDDNKIWLFQEFAYKILQIDKEDINPRIKEAWKVQFKPIDEVVKDIYVRAAKEEGIKQGLEQGLEKGLEKKAFEVAQKMLSRNVPVSDIVDMTGLNEKDILALELIT
jgi:predicted transposase/invertase (TIGR01784 family)